MMKMPVARPNTETARQAFATPRKSRVRCKMMSGRATNCSSVKPQSHTSSLGSGVELSERTTSSKVRSETVDSILSAVAKKKVVISDKGTENFDS